MRVVRGARQAADRAARLLHFSDERQKRLALAGEGVADGYAVAP